MVESLPNGVSWTNLMAGICSLRDQHASPKPPDGDCHRSLNPMNAETSLADFSELAAFTYSLVIRL